MRMNLTRIFLNLFLILFYCNSFAFNSGEGSRDACIPMTLTEAISYTEDFSTYAGTSENSTSGVMPDCWDRIYLGNLAHTGYAPHIVTGSSNAPNGTGNNCLHLYAGSTDYGPSSYAIFPAFTNDLSTLEVDFAVGMNTFGSGQCLSLGYITDITDPDSYVSLRPFDNIYTPDDGTTSYAVRLDGYTIPTGARLCFRWTTSWNNCYIDDLTVRIIPSCVAPDVLTYSHLTSAGVTMEWTTAGDETAWTVEYGTTGHTPGSGTMLSVFAHPYQLTGLVSGETYEVYVRAACGASEFSEWTGPVSFRVPCPPSTITAGQPYTEDFSAYAGTSENSTSGVMPDCWDRIYLGNLAHTGYAPHIVTGSSNAPNGTGNNCLHLYAGSTDYGPSSYAIFPAFTNDLSTLEVDFAVGMNTFGSGQCLSLGYITDITDPNSYVSLRPFDNIYTPDDGTTSYAVRMDGYSIPTGARLCFRWTTSWNNCYIDDLTVRIIPSCVAPDVLTYSHLTSAGVIMEWTPAGDETAWTVEYGTTGHTPGSGTMLSVFAHPYQLTGLVSGETYEVYVRAACGASEFSEWTGPVSFRVPCPPSTITAAQPYTEDFSAHTGTSENSTSGVMPDCWDRIYLGNLAHTGYAPHIVTGSSNAPNGTGNNCLHLYAGSTDYGPSSYAIFPAFTNDLSTLEVDFAVGMNTFGSGQCLSLGYITDITDPDSYVSLRPFDNIYTPNDGTTSYAVRLDGYSIPTGARLCFRWTTSWNNCYIDDLTVRIIPSCVAPDVLTYSHLTSAGVTMEWTPAGDETAWTVEYGTTGHTPGNGTMLSVSGHPYQLTGLVSGETYEVYVRAACGTSEFSEWTGPVSFRVPCPPSTITAAQPYTEDFSAYTGTSENSTSGVMPDCWDRIYLGNLAHTGYAPHIVTGSSNAPNGTGNNCLHLYAGSTDYGPSSYAIFPAFTNDLSTLEVDFAVGMNTFGSGQCLSLGYITDITDPDSYVSLRPFDNIYTPNEGTTSYAVRLDGYTIPTGARLCFRWTTSWNNCYIDDLTVRLIYATIDTTVCDNSLPLVWNGVTFTEAGSQWAILTSSSNTDSLVLMTLNTMMSSYATMDTTVCASALPFNWNGLTIAVGGTQTVTLTNHLGCDSTITLNVNVVQEGVSEFSVEACELYVWNNITYSQSGDYTQTFPLPGVCDSVVTLHLTIHPAPNITITGNTEIMSGEQTTLTATGGAFYQWSTGDTDPSIMVSPTESTSYTVTGTDAYGCTGTASTLVTVITGISEAEGPVFVVYPNPASELINIEYESVENDGVVSGRLFNSAGQIVKEFDLDGRITQLNIQDLTPGVYLLYLRNRNSLIGIRKVIVH